LDGNVKRVVARLLRIEASIDERGTTDDLWEAADVLLPRQQAGDFNQAMMELGARICIPRQPQCLVCPVAGLCGARAAGVEQSLPRRSQKKPIPEIRAFAALVERDGRFLVARRPERGLLGGMWELPTVEEGDVDAGRRALRRLVGDLIGPIQLGAPIADVTHAYTHRRVQLTLLRATAVSPTVDRRPAAEQRWLNAREIDELAFGKLYHKALAAAGVKPLAREKSAH
jgi:A/G-specific adenine glycosylase